MAFWRDGMHARIGGGRGQGERHRHGCEKGADKGFHGGLLWVCVIGDAVADYEFA
jgi:hypothetical protein